MQNASAIQTTPSQMNESAFQAILQDPSTLSEIHNRFVKINEETFSNALRRHTYINVLSVDTWSYEDLRNNVSELASYNFFHLKPTTIFGCIILDPPLIFQLLQLFFGGNDTLKTPSQRKGFTEIEFRMIKRVVMSVYEDLTEAWSPITPLEVVYSWNDVSSVEWLKSFNVEDKVVRVALSMTIKDLPQVFPLTLYYRSQSKKLMSYFNYLEGQHPQTIALILAHGMDIDNAAFNLKEFPEDTRADILYRIASLEEVPPGIIAELKATVAGNLSIQQFDHLADTTGRERAIDLLKSMEPSEQDKMFQFWQADQSVDATWIESIKAAISN